MPLIDSRLKPGQWTRNVQGASRRWYVIRYQGSRFLALSRQETWTKGPAWSRPLYWRRIFTSYTNAEVPHGKLVLEAFADIGFSTKLTVAGFIAGQHTQIKRVD